MVLLKDIQMQPSRSKSGEGFFYGEMYAAKAEETLPVSRLP